MRTLIRNVAAATIDPELGDLARTDILIEDGVIRGIRPDIAVDDAGSVVNPVVFEGQQQGGVGQGVSQALYEEVVYDEGGNLITGNLMDYAMPAATSSLLDDAAVDIDAWIADEVETAFAEQEGAAFINGDGVNKPKGFLDIPVVGETNWTWGNLGYVPTGTDGALAAADGSDVLVDTIYALKAGYRQNGNWVMNRKTQAALRKLKDGDGNYLWQAPATADARARLMGFPVVEAEDMPDIATDETAIAFGDFRRGYLVVDRAGVSVLRDPYSAKPYVLFYTTKRVGGGIQDFDAIKLVKFGTA